MKIKEALDARIPRVRKPIWANPECYLRLPLMKDNRYGPWAELYDENMIGINSDIVCQKLLIFEVLEQDGFEPYTGKPSKLEQENYAKVYLEQ